MTRAVVEGELLWSPSPERVAAAPITAYRKWLEITKGMRFAEYQQLWEWSTREVEDFWGGLWEYFDVISDSPYRQVLSSRRMPGARWFEGSRVNYAEHILRHEQADPSRVALYFQCEDGPQGSVSWAGLGERVRSVATSLRELGVKPGDRVASYLPNVPEAVVAMLATAAIGATWCSAPPEFGVTSVLERFQQLEPTVLILPNGYRYGGRTHSRDDEGGRILAGLPSVRHIIRVDVVDGVTSTVDALAWHAIAHRQAPSREDFRFERVAHDHPLWVLFSSGTTGLPKAIVHSHVGILLELLKLTHLHGGITSESTTFFYTTTGWMMWNYLVSNLLMGGSIVLYDGNPGYPTVETIWRVAERTRTTQLGTSASFLQLVEKSGFAPGESLDLSALRCILLSGSPTTPETYAWAYRKVSADLWVDSVSGGTELCSAFVGGVETLPVRAGEMQARMLGMDVHAWDEGGGEVVGGVGELVCLTPSPSMPLRLWNDPGDERYRDTYFDTYPGVWRHGDYLKITDNGGCYIYGRSDATLNRNGVRIGTAEIYRAVEHLDEIVDSLVVCLELEDGAYFMPLFVQLRPGVELDESLRGRINARLRADCSPRHVPDRIDAVEQIPYTLTGKKMEIPVRKILAGAPMERVASRDAMRNPESLAPFARYTDEVVTERRTTSSAPKEK